MLYLTCTTITSVDLAHYGVSRAKDWVSVDCGTNKLIINFEDYSTVFQQNNFYISRESPVLNVGGNGMINICRCLAAFIELPLCAI